MRAQGQGAGLRQLRQIMVRMVKGEVGMRLEIWRMAMSTEASAYLEWQSKCVEMVFFAAGQQMALRWLSRMAARGVARQLGTSVRQWHASVRAKIASMQASLEAYASGIEDGIQVTQFNIQKLKRAAFMYLHLVLSSHAKQRARHLLASWRQHLWETELHHTEEELATEHFALMKLKDRMRHSLSEARIAHYISQPRSPSRSLSHIIASPSRSPSPQVRNFL